MKQIGLAAVVVAMLCGAVLIDEAAAHARLVRADPARGSTLATPPTVVRLWFQLGGEELDPRRSVVSVWDVRGRRVDDGKGGVDLDDLDRTSMIARLKPIGPGSYTVRWRAVSSPDGSVAQGSFRFTVVRR